MTDTIEKEQTVTVCDKCFQASCWKGIFMCDESRYAGTTEKTISELKQLLTDLRAKLRIIENKFSH